MGEYANLNGERVKIGTCESMYYLRADQAHLVEAVQGSVDPLRDRDGLRFRFPFPDEDHLEPGTFDDFDRGVRIPDYQLPVEYGDQHHSVQFTSSAGYVLSIPCPEQFGQPGMGVELPNGLRVGRNGFNGHPEVRAQKWVDGRLVLVVACGACGAMWRVEELHQAEEIAVAFRSEADRKEPRGAGEWQPAHSEHGQKFMHAIADRILAGYVAESVV